MNCKPGDLAIVVSGFTQWSQSNIGKIVEVVCVWHGNGTCGLPFSWTCRGNVVNGMGIKLDEVAFCDCDLRPLRGWDGVDEMVRIAGRPERVEA